MPGARLTRALAWTGAGALVLAAAEAVIVGLVVPEGAIWMVAMGALFVAGAVAVRHRPRDLAARRLLLLGTAAIVWMAGGLSLGIAHRQLGAGSWLVVPDTLMVGLDLALPAAILGALAVYPDGAAQRSYETWLVQAGAALALAVPLLLLLARPVLQPMLAFTWLSGYAGPAPEHVASPLHVGALSFLGGPLAFYAKAALGILPALAAVVLALRYRRFGPDRRLQIRWPLAALLLAALQPLGDGLVAAGALPKDAVDVPVVIAITGLAAALAVGLVRPGLFDLGRAVRHSLAYVALWAVLGAAYVGIAAAAGIAAAGQGLQVAIAVTIAVTLLAAPARRALERRVSRWAYGERLSGPQLLRRVGAALEHTLSPAELAATLAETVRDGLGIEWVRITLAGEEPVLAGGPPPPGGPVGARMPLTHAGEELGVLECAPAVPPPDPHVLGNLARQAALAIRNARLASRIVEAEERGRRRIERDIHDGVQQELVALIARIGLARQQLGRGDPELVRQTLEDLQSETRQALADLRELAGGIHPSALADRGIVEAVEGRAARLPLGVTIVCDPALREARFAPAVEGAVYFLVSEGFANALKHAGAERVTVRLGGGAGTLEVEVSDDGRGFDVPGTPRSGLDGLADRTAALGGSFGVESAPGCGTTLRATFPVGDRAPVA